MTAMSLTIDEAQDEIVEEFELFGDDGDMRNSYIFDLGRKLAPMPPEYHTEQYIVKGCQALVWVHTECRDGRLYFEVDSNAAIPKGLIALAVRLYSGRTPQEIAETPPDFIDRIGMSKHISSSRSNGLLSVIGRMKQEAAAALANGNK